MRNTNKVTMPSFVLRACVRECVRASINDHPTISKSKFYLADKGKGSFYIAQYPVRWTAQSALHFLPSLTDLFIPTPFSASPGSILARQQLRAKTKSLTDNAVSCIQYSQQWP